MSDIQLYCVLSVCVTGFMYFLRTEDSFSLLSEILLCFSVIVSF